jgi:hypothetical protein
LVAGIWTSATIFAECDAVTRLITDVYAGKLHPRIATGLGPLMHLQLRVLEKTDFEQRLARIEKQLKAIWRIGE